MLRRRRNKARDLIAVDYAVLSQAARLAAALRALDQWLSHVGVADPEIDRLIEHLWAYPTITYKTFAGWESSVDDCDVLDMALGYDMPGRLIARCRELGISADHLRTAITSATEIVYSSLYAAVSDGLTLRSSLRWNSSRASTVSGCRQPSSTGRLPFLNGMVRDT